LAQVLGRVAGVHLDSPRGADVVHSIRVAAAWLERGEAVEVTLPRNLCCAGCAGGGCDRCARSGAVSLWGRDEPPAVLELTLPRRRADELEREPGIVLRIPDAGGFAEPESGLPRGLLLLKVTASPEPDPSVVRVKRSILSPERLPSIRSLTPTPNRIALGVVAASLLIVLAVLALMWR
jgi:hypothetical protein